MTQPSTDSAPKDPIETLGVAPVAPLENWQSRQIQGGLRVNDGVGIRREPRDKRWFLRIVAWMLFALGTTGLLLGVLPSDDAGGLTGVVSTKTVIALASLPFVAFGSFLLVWGYTKFGEPLLSCPWCMHINKQRAADCAGCGEALN